MSGVTSRLWRAIGRGRRQDRVAELSASELQGWLNEGREVQILDIRDAGAFRAAHLPGARHRPLNRLKAELATLDRERATVVY